MFKQYKRIAIAEMRPVTNKETIIGIDSMNNLNISVSDEDLLAGSPLPGDMIARNPKNYKNQWLVASQYFKDNFKEL